MVGQQDAVAPLKIWSAVWAPGVLNRADESLNLVRIVREGTREPDLRVIAILLHPSTDGVVH